MRSNGGDPMKHLLLLCLCFVALTPLNGQQGDVVYGDQPQHPTASTIRNVLFKNASRISQEERNELGMRVRRNADSPDHVLALAQELIREACHNEGYFKAKVNVVAEPVPGNTDEREFDVVVKVLDYGKQYRLREIHFINARAFSEEELLMLIPIQPGEVFSRARIVRGLEAVHEHYEAAGYKNVTYIPNTEFDDSNATARLDIDMDEGDLSQ